MRVLWQVSFPAFVGLFSLLLRLSAGDHAVDDAYITFRYATNLANGQGLVYNLGERVLGTWDPPLYAIILGALAWLGDPGNIPRIALWVNALADGMSSRTRLLDWEVRAVAIRCGIVG